MSTLPAFACFLLSLPGPRAAAANAPPSPTDRTQAAAAPATSAPETSPRAAAAQHAGPPATGGAATVLRHRVELIGLSSGLLHHNQHDARGASTMSQLRGQVQAAARLRIDPAGAFAIGAAVGTGASFRSGWNHTAIGSRAADASLHVKQLYAAVRPSPRVQMQAGSFGPARGYASEMTGLDNDGYLVGERLTLRPSRLWFDEVVVTRAYLGDLASVSAFDRMRRLSTANYVQAIGARRLSMGGVSVEYAELDDRRTAGGALQTTRVRGLSHLRVEASTTVAGRRASALAAVAERAAGPVTIGLGASRVAAPLGVLNGDRYGAGGRVFAQGAWRPRPELSISVFGSRAVGAVAQEPRTRLDLLVNLDILRALTRPR